MKAGNAPAEDLPARARLMQLRRDLTLLLDVAPMVLHAMAALQYVAQSTAFELQDHLMADVLLAAMDAHVVPHTFDNLSPDQLQASQMRQLSERIQAALAGTCLRAVCCHMMSMDGCVAMPKWTSCCAEQHLKNMSTW